MQKQVQLFKALSDSTRLRILLLLQNNGELCVCDIMESLRIPQSTASRHLALLRSAGLVAGERHGVWMHYRIDEEQGLGLSVLACLSRYCSELESAAEDNNRFKEYLKSKNQSNCSSKNN